MCTPRTKILFRYCSLFFFLLLTEEIASPKDREQWYMGVDSIDKCSKDAAGFETTTIEALRRCERFAILTASRLNLKSSHVVGMTFERQGKCWDNILTRSRKRYRMRAMLSALSIFFHCLVEPSGQTETRYAEAVPVLSVVHPFNITTVLHGQHVFHVVQQLGSRNVQGSHLMEVAILGMQMNITATYLWERSSKHTHLHCDSAIKDV